MLRNYQIEAKNKVQKSVFRKNILQMPTGSGKTFTFIEIAKDYFAENTQRVLILVHRTELLKQAQKSLGEKCFLIEAGIKNIPHDYNYYIGMVETTFKRVKKLPKFGLIIIDECHIGNFKKMPYFESDCQSKILGVTATPISEQPLSLHYDNLILGPSVSDLIDNKHLLDCEVYGFASDLVSNANFKVKRGEFDEQQMEDFYSSEKMVKNVLQAYWDYSAGKKTLIFNVNVKHNEAVRRAFENEGLEVRSITGETPKDERREILTWYQNISHAILCNVGVFTTGFDEPTIQTIILNRATKSLSLYLQMIGRGSRLSDGKELFKVLDLGKNTIRHGQYTDYFDWETYFKYGTKKENAGQGIAPAKECPECSFIQHTRKLTCVHCGFSFEDEAEKQRKEEVEQKLVLFLRKKPLIIPTERIYEMAKERGWKEYAVLHKIAEHLNFYYQKHKQNIPIDYIYNALAVEVVTWCRVFEKRAGNWINDISKKILKQKIDESERTQAAG